MSVLSHFGFPLINYQIFLSVQECHSSFIHCFWLGDSTTLQFLSQHFLTAASNTKYA